MTREQACMVSMEKKYYFKINPVHLSLNHYMDIVRYYDDSVNIIESNFLTKIKLLKSGNSISLITNPFSTDPEKNDELNVSNPGYFQKEIEEEETEEDEDEEDEDVDENDERENYEEEMKCPFCETLFTTKKGLLKHVSNRKKSTKLCDNKKTYNSLKKIRNQKKAMAMASVPVIQNIHNGNGDLISNVQHVQNTNNNISLNIPTSPVKDFMHDIYDYTHIDYYDLSNDFYILKNFLALMLENKTNHNILFWDDSKNTALVYTRDDIRKMSPDKAGFILIEKLQKTMDNLIRHVVKDEEKRKEFLFMNKYYKNILNKYRCDTTYREYDTDTHQFFSTSHGNQLRSRDEYLADMMGIINRFSTTIQENLLPNGIESIENISYVRIEPSIEDYASARVRNRDLKA